MRSFRDHEDRAWQAALLEASYGRITLVFSPLAGGAITYKLLDADHLAEAEKWLSTLSDDALRELLAQAATWDSADQAGASGR